MPILLTALYNWMEKWKKVVEADTLMSEDSPLKLQYGG